MKVDKDEQDKRRRVLTHAQVAQLAKLHRRTLIGTTKMSEVKGEQEAIEQMTSRIEKLERDLQETRATLDRLTSTSAHHVAPTPQKAAVARSVGEVTLPDGYSALTAWCELHGIAETTARTYSRPDDFKKGKWYDHDGSLVKVAIDRSTQHHLWGIFHHKTKFTPCDLCPHSQE